MKDIIERLRTANRNITDELKNTAENLESTIESENMNPEKWITTIQFLTKQMAHSYTYAPTLMKTAFFLPNSAIKEYLSLL